MTAGSVRNLSIGMPIRGRRLRWLAVGRRTSYLLYWVSAMTGLPGLALRSPLLICACSVFLAMAFVASDLSRGDIKSVSAITVYSLAAAATGFANAVALLFIDSPRRSLYFIYLAEDHLFLASLLSVAGVALPVMSFWLVARGREFLPFLNALPDITGRLPDSKIVVLGSVLAAMAILTHVVRPSQALGTVVTVFFWSPHFVAFTLARAGTERKVRGALTVALVIAFAESIRSLLFDYLRGDMASPVIAFVAGALLGSRSLRPLRTKIFMPVYAAVALFVIYFGAFGSVRSEGVAGLMRLEAVYELEGQAPTATGRPKQTILARLTTLNQLSQIGRVSEEDGFLGGETLEYLAYAFIPRAFWPSKPQIAKGAWWALRIDQARIGSDGRITNSLNMTIPGELYLNFGWSGVMIGCLLFGAFLAVLWIKTDFWSRRPNIVGTAFAFYLLWVWVGFSLGADLQVIVTLIAMYLLFVALGVAMRVFGIGSSMQVEVPRRSEAT